MNKIFTAIDAFFEKAENYFGRFTFSVFIGLVLLILTGVFYAVRYETYYHGNGFTRLSLHPFQMEGENDLRFRILSPLMGHILFMRGVLFKYFMLLVLALFFAMIYFFKRRESFSPSEAIGLTFLFAFSTLAFY